MKWVCKSYLRITRCRLMVWCGYKVNVLYEYYTVYCITSLVKMVFIYSQISLYPCRYLLSNWNVFTDCFFFIIEISFIHDSIRFFFKIAFFFKKYGFCALQRNFLFVCCLLLIHFFIIVAVYERQYWKRTISWAHRASS